MKCKQKTSKLREHAFNKKRLASLALGERRISLPAGVGWKGFVGNIICHYAEGQQWARDFPRISFLLLSASLWRHASCACIMAIYPLSSIGNMDETPLWLDMPGDTTITRQGDRTVCICTTGHVKMRFTVVLSAMADGESLNLMCTCK